MMIFFISDLHLSEARPEITQAFFKFLDTTAARASALYILGDFFDAWVGDDDDTPAFKEIETALKVYCLNTTVFFMHGNRDFMIGEDFIQRTGITLLNEPTVIKLNGVSTLLMHGDSLCTRDSQYMGFREMVRNPEWKRNILLKPLNERKAIAAQFRASSKSMSSLKAEDIMDVTTDDVIKVMSEYDTPRLIHGHTHRPARHPVSLKQHIDGERIVLGDWDTEVWYLEANSETNKIKLQSYSIKI